MATVYHHILLNRCICLILLHSSIVQALLRDLYQSKRTYPELKSLENEKWVHFIQLPANKNALCLFYVFFLPCRELFISLPQNRLRKEAQSICSTSGVWGVDLNCTVYTFNNVKGFSSHGKINFIYKTLLTIKENRTWIDIVLDNGVKTQYVY